MQPAFEKAYGQNGHWVKFYEPCGDFLGSELIRNTNGMSYLIIDKWKGKSEGEEYIKSNQLEYADLNTKSKDLYDNEEFVGSYELI